MDYDVFVSHASEDKDLVARPLAQQLELRGLRVWLDEFELTVGDSLRRKIDHGLAQSRFGVVILSPAFFAKEWPNKELDGLVAREDGGEKVILPVWHNISAMEVARRSPLLAAKIAATTTHGLSNVVGALLLAIQQDTGAITRVKSPSDIDASVLQRVRQQMLLSPSSRELRRAAYELDSHLAHFPHSVDARELQDQLKIALRRAEAYELPPKVMAPAPSAPAEASGAPQGSRVFLFLALAVIAILAYLALRYLGLL